MKKSKILMPLTGIAAIGAIAPVVAMTGCSHSYTLIKSGTIGHGMDQVTGFMTNRLGVQTLDSTGQFATDQDIYLDLGVELTKTFESQHTCTATLEGKGTPGKDGTPFIVAAEAVNGIASEAGKNKWFVPADSTATPKTGVHLKTNALKMKALADADKEESFSFNIVFEEFDRDYKEPGAKSVGKQTYTFTVVACPKLNDLPKLVEEDLTGEVSATGTNVTLKGFGYVDADKALQQIEVKFASTEKLELYATQGTEKRTLTIGGADAKAIVPVEGKTINFYGTLDKAIGTVTSPLTFKDVDAGKFDVTLVFTTSKGKYVETEWKQSVQFLANEGIDVANS